MTRVPYVLAALALSAVACSTPALPADIEALVSAAAPGITITNGAPDAANEEYEVTGTMPNGDEVELDLVRSNGSWTVLEIQRDVAWSSVPEPVRAAAAAAPNTFEPVRVIESQQPADGSVVFELFSPTTRGPAMEVGWHNGQAEVLSRSR
jgi:hypothetical protein